MIDGVFQQAPFDKKIDDEISEKITNDYLKFEYISSDKCSKCGLITKGIHDAKKGIFVCKFCLLDENFERRFNEERSKLG